MCGYAECSRSHIPSEAGELELLLLLIDAPEGEYLAEQRGGVRVLWRISEGEPGDAALEPAEAWVFRLPEPLAA